MSQPNYQLPTTGLLSGLSAVADINAAFEGIATMNSGASAPPSGTWTTDVPAGAFWLNTSTTPYTIEIGDGTDWLPFGYLDPVNHLFTIAGPSGSLLFFMGGPAALPPGCLLAYGQVVSAVTYPNLLTAFGTKYGGNGTTTVGLPDLRGLVVAGVDNMGGAAAGVLPAFTSVGHVGGAASITLSTGQIPAHNHSDSGHTHGTSDPGHSHGTSDPGHAHNYTEMTIQSAGTTLAGASPGLSQLSTNTGSATTGISINSSGTGISVNSSNANIQNTGGGGSHSNIQPTIGANLAIWI